MNMADQFYMIKLFVSLAVHWMNVSLPQLDCRPFRDRAYIFYFHFISFNFKFYRSHQIVTIYVLLKKMPLYPASVDVKVFWSTDFMPCFDFYQPMLVNSSLEIHNVTCWQIWRTIFDN